MREDRPAPDLVEITGASSSASRSAGSLARNRPLARSASTSGSVVPLTDRVEHRAAQDAGDVGGAAVELAAGVLERLVQPVRFPGALLDLRLAIPRQVPKRPGSAWAARSSRVAARPPRAGQSHSASLTSVLRPAGQRCLTGAGNPFTVHNVHGLRTYQVADGRHHAPTNSRSCGSASLTVVAESRP